MILAAKKNDLIDSVGFPRTSGHYSFKSWGIDKQGKRFAQKSNGLVQKLNADLISNTYHNACGLETAYGLVFDFDAHRALPCWKDSEGKLDWNLIFPALKKEIPIVAELICYAVRSSGGKGLGIVMAITPLPIISSTAANQQSALKLQGRLLTVFDSMGLGADFGARGVVRDFPNFKNPVRSVYINTAPLRRLENTREAVISQLHSYLNKRQQSQRKDNRLYNDERVEKGLAKLVQWLSGTARFDRSFNFDGMILERKFKSIPFLSGWTVNASIQELSSLTGLGEVFIRKFLKNPPQWLQSRLCETEGWSLALPLSKDTPWLLERSTYLLQNTKELKGKVSFNPQELSLPWFVQDGNRNEWIVRLTLAYKWAGYSQSSTLEKVLLRIEAIPGKELSRNCKHVASIVRSLYRKMPENLGVLSWKELPDWIREDSLFCSLHKRVSLRRGITPVARFEVQGVMVGSVGSSSPVSPVPFHASIDLKAQTEVPNDGLSKPISVSSRPIVTLLVVRRKQRIGIFKNNKLLMCLTKKHYKASNLLNYLKDLNPKLSEIGIRFVSPRKAKQELYFTEIDNAEMVHSAKSICGRIATRYESMDLWREKKGIKPEIQEAIVTFDNLEFESPF